MKKNRGISCLALLALCWGTARGGETIFLNGKWDLSYWEQPDRAITDPADIKGVDVKTISATVPGNVELDLQNAGVLKDLTIGNNVYDLRPYEFYQWCYTKTFATPKLEKGQSLRLTFNGIDCLADVWLNGKLIGTPEDMFIEHRYDITGLVDKDGANTLQVIIRSAVLEAQLYLPSTLVGRNDEQCNIRKAPSQYGWDIMPRVVSAGLWRGVTLDVLDPVRIENIQWVTLETDPAAKTATLSMTAQYRMPGDSYDKLQSEVVLSRNGKQVFSKKRDALHVPVERLSIHLENADLWWPRGYGDAALYDATVRILDQSGKVLAENTQKVGLRTVYLDKTDINLPPDKPGRFCFVVNGEKIFIHGTNWGPLDACHSRDSMRVADVLALAVELNCNMIRCWGGNVYEDNNFFDICDREGIMVWQDFAMACSLYPCTPDFQQKIYDEVRAVAIKLRNHPSLALWSGNNENDRSTRWMKHLRAFKFDPNRDKISREVIPNALLDVDISRPYLPSSPYFSQAVYNNGENMEDFLPEDHLWGKREYYKTPFYSKPTCVFVSEIGYHACPNRETLEKMFDKDYVYPWTNKTDYQWNSQWTTKANSDITNNRYTRNNYMINHCRELFGTCPTDLDDFILASQSAQAEAFKYWIELWRAAKFDRMGILWWDLRDGWPQSSNAVCDYYMSKKMSFYYIENVERNVCVVVNDPVDGGYPLVAVNDTRTPASGNVEVSDIATEKVLWKGKFDMEANGKTVIAQIPEMAGQGVLLIKYSVDGKEYLNHYLYGEPPFKLSDYSAWMKKTGIYPNLKWI